MYRIGIIGCGKIAQVRHIPEYLANPDTEITALYDLNTGRARSLADSLNASACTSVDELLDADLDAVSVCTSNDSHAEITIRALKKGLDVLCEKPMATRLEDAKAMAEAAREAYEALLHTRDGQLCDVIIDRAALDAIYQAGLKAKDKIIKDYAESIVAVADIRIAVRSQKTGKTVDFMKRAMAECESLNVDQLARAAAGGMEAVTEYLSGTAYAQGGQAIAESPSAFERWCDNRLMQDMQPQKYEVFSVGPLVAYVLARLNEIKTVRIILSGKQNGFSDDSIRERVRDMYV